MKMKKKLILHSGNSGSFSDKFKQYIIFSIFPYFILASTEKKKTLQYNETTEFYHSTAFQGLWVCCIRERPYFYSMNGTIQWMKLTDLRCYFKKITKTSKVKLLVPQILFLYRHWQAAPSNFLCAFCLPLPYEQATTNPCQKFATGEKMCLHDIFSFKLFNVTNNYYMRWELFDDWVNTGLNFELMIGHDDMIKQNSSSPYNWYTDVFLLKA